MKRLIDVVEEGINEVKRLNDARTQVGEHPLTERSQASVISHRVEQALRASLADQVMYLLFPSPPDA